MQNTPTEEQLQAALELSKEKRKLVKEAAALQEKIAGIDAKIQAALTGTAKTPKKVKTPKAEKAPKVAKAPKAPSEGRHGKLKDSIIEALKAAGPEGLSVKDLAEKLGKDSKPLSVWFSTTGAKTPGIIKVQRGTFAYAAPAPAALETPEAPAPAETPEAPAE